MFNLGLYRLKGIADHKKILNTTENVLANFGVSLERDIISITSDAASVMKAAFQSVSAFHQLCLNHGVHLAVIDVIYPRNNSNFVKKNQR